VWNARRRQLADLYRELLSGTDLVLPAQNAGHVYHQFVIRHPRRDALREYLKECGISTLVHYPVPIHLQPAYTDLGYPSGSLPMTERASREVLSLPIYPELTEEMVGLVCQAILDFSAQ
jgi:dTDP-4-amino-4,6-dideoxygalactose transaminase